MSKRLQVLLPEPEWREVQRAARADGTTVAEWVRRALLLARREGSSKDVEGKLSAIRRAARHSFPTAEVEQLNTEIASGYLDSRKP